MNDKTSRPEIADTDANIKSYHTIFIGFPIWWYSAPTIINTFLEAYDFTGKKIVLFATSDGSGFGKTFNNLKHSVDKDTKLVERRLLNSRNSKAELKAWAESVR